MRAVRTGLDPLVSRAPRAAASGHCSRNQAPGVDKNRATCQARHVRRFVGDLAAPPGHQELQEFQNAAEHCEPDETEDGIVPAEGSHGHQRQEAVRPEMEKLIIDPGCGHRLHDAAVAWEQFPNDDSDNRDRPEED